jgi:hypothetical protein
LNSNSKHEKFEITNHPAYDREPFPFSPFPYRLDRVQKRIDNYTNGRVKLTPEMREVYKTIGGTPHLDGQYTVFGEVVSGLNVVDAIQQVTTDTNDRPIEDVRIIRAYLR